MHFKGNQIKFQVCTLEKWSELINALILLNIANQIIKIMKITSSMVLQHITMV